MRKCSFSVQPMDSISLMVRNWLNSNTICLLSEDFPDANGSYVGVIGAVQNGIADATIEDFFLDREKIRKFHLTLPFVTMTMVRTEITLFSSSYSYPDWYVYTSSWIGSVAFGCFHSLPIQNRRDYDRIGNCGLPYWTSNEMDEN